MLRIVARLSRRARTIPCKSPLIKVTPALYIAASVPVPIAMPTCAWASLLPSPACDETALILQFLHGRSLLIRQHLGHDLVDAELACDGLRRGAAVPGQHHHAVALLPQRLQGAGGAFFEGIGDGDKSCRPPVDGDQHYPLTLLAKLLRASGQITRIDPKRSKKCPVADGDMFAVDRADDTHPGLRRKVERGAELDFALLGTSDDGGCKRMLAIPFETGDKPQQLVLANGGSRGDTNEPRLAKR